MKNERAHFSEIKIIIYYEVSERRGHFSEKTIDGMGEGRERCLNDCHKELLFLGEASALPRARSSPKPVFDVYSLQYIAYSISWERGRGGIFSP